MEETKEKKQLVINDDGEVVEELKKQTIVGNSNGGMLHTDSTEETDEIMEEVTEETDEVEEYEEV